MWVEWESVSFVCICIELSVPCSISSVTIVQFWRMVTQSWYGTETRVHIIFKCSSTVEVLNIERWESVLTVGISNAWCTQYFSNNVTMVCLAKRRLHVRVDDLNRSFHFDIHHTIISFPSSLKAAIDTDSTCYFVQVKCCFDYPYTIKNERCLRLILKNKEVCFNSIQ